LKFFIIEEEEGTRLRTGLNGKEAEKTMNTRPVTFFMCAEEKF
jgi:hypothetical protein